MKFLSNSCTLSVISFTGVVDLIVNFVIWIVRKVSGLLGKFPDNLESFGMVWEISRWFGEFPEVSALPKFLEPGVRQPS